MNSGMNWKVACFLNLLYLPCIFKEHKLLVDSDKSCSEKCLTLHVKGHKETYVHRCVPWTPEKRILGWLQGYDIASKQRFVKNVTYKKLENIWTFFSFKKIYLILWPRGNVSLHIWANRFFKLYLWSDSSGKIWPFISHPSHHCRERTFNYSVLPSG